MPSSFTPNLKMPSVERVRLVRKRAEIGSSAATTARIIFIISASCSPESTYWVSTVHSSTLAARYMRLKPGAAVLPPEHILSRSSFILLISRLGLLKKFME